MPNARNRKAMKKKKEAEKAKAALASKRRKEAKEDAKDTHNPNPNNEQKALKSPKTNPGPPFGKVDEILNLSTEELMQSTSLRVETLRGQFHSSTPFKHCIVPNFLNPDFASLLKDELLHENFYQKSNDLYDFTQTKELSNLKKPLISRFTQVMKRFGGVIKDVSEIGQLEHERFDMFGAIYSHTCKLLCHDDRMPGRRIAYVYYLVPEDWCESDGGHLDLYQTNVKGNVGLVSGSAYPVRVSNSILPKYNSILFFEVSKISFHQVREVLRRKKGRVSITGWFYGPTIDAKDAFSIPCPTYIKPRVNAAVEPSKYLESWVNRVYRKANMVKKVKKAFLEESSIELRNFLKKDKYGQLLSCLARVMEQKFHTTVGPPHKQSYLRLGSVSEANLGEMQDDETKASSTSGEETMSPDFAVLKDLKEFLTSKAFAGLVEQLTGLELTAACHEIRAFRPGDYTLANDEDPFMKTEGLDVMLCCTPTGVNWNLKSGGSVHYVDGEEELLTIEPCANTLAIVYRAEAGTSRFVKYLNSSAPCLRFDVCCTFLCKEESGAGATDEDEN